MYDTTGAITGVSLDGGPKRTSPLDKIRKNFLANVNQNNTVKKGATGPSIYGFGFPASNSSATGAANL